MIIKGGAGKRRRDDADSALYCAQGYYQEAGRAGRDGAPSECVLLWARRDIPRFIKMQRTKPRAVREREMKALTEAHALPLYTLLRDPQSVGLLFGAATASYMFRACQSDGTWQRLLSAAW